MKKFLKMLALVMMLTITTACGKEVANCDERLISESQQVIQEWGVISDRTFSVSLDNGIYVVNINGNIQKVQVPEFDNKPAEIEGIEEVSNKKIISICERAKEKIKRYIDSSHIIKEKEDVKKKIDEINIIFSNTDYAAYYNGSIYIGKECLEYVYEWMILHEYVHALAEVTNKGIENEPYALTEFNEVLTDIITAYMKPDIIKGIQSAYTFYYEDIMAYIGCFEEKAIYTYFYGYDELYELVGKEEFDFFVFSFENMFEFELSRICVNNFINKWGSLVVEK